MIELNSEDSTASIAQRVFVKQINLSFLKMRFPLIGLVVIGVLLFYFLSYSVSWGVLLPWVVMYFSVLLYRILSLVFYYWQLRHGKNINARTLGYIYYLGVLLLGANFSGLILFVMPKLDVKGQLLLLLTVMGVSLASTVSMSFRKAPVCSFIPMMILPLMYMAYELAVPNTLAMTIALFIFLVFMLHIAISVFKATSDMLWLQEKAVDHENELMLQKKDAQRANNAKSEFLSRMSHELRTPLNAVIGLNDLMRVDKVEPLTEKQSGRATKINEAAQHLLKLMNDVLDLSRIETGDLNVCSEPIDAVAIVNEILVLVESKMHSREITFNFAQSTESVWLQGDILRLKQVLFNLFDNAIKYNRKGGLVTINLEQLGEMFLRLSVVDTGYGLSNEDIEKLFVPFSRLGAEQLGIDGTGIGLSYSKQLVELMHGKIGVDSEQGRGSCFWFELPVAQPPLPVSDEVAGKDVSVEIESTDDSPIAEGVLPSIHILLVEDNLVNQELVIDMLDRADYHVDVVNNGKAAVAACSSHSYNLVLMDCEMPIMNGVRATEIIRQQGNTVPIIALTAHAVDGAQEKCINAGMDDFLSKPFVSSEIQSIVEKWTNSERVISENIALQSEADKKPLLSSDSQQGKKMSDTEKQPDLSVNSVIDMVVIGRLQQTKKSSQVAAKKKRPLLARVLGLYLEQTPLLLQQLRDAVSENSIEGIVDCAHTLKSSSAAVGASKLTEMFKEIELLGRDGKLDLTKMEHRLSEIHHNYQEVEVALNGILVGES